MAPRPGEPALRILATAACLALSGGAAGGELKVAAAADLKFAMADVERAFSAAHDGARLVTSFGSSGNFYAQIANGAPFDAFLSADVEYPSRLHAAGLTLDEPFPYAVGRLAHWVPRGSTLPIERQGLGALASADLRRLAIANPRHAPYGAAAEAALRKADLLGRLTPKLVLGENVSQAAQFAQSGAADAGLIALSLALAPALAETGRYVEVDRSLYPPLRQAGAILTRAADAGLARAFRDFLLSPVGQQILARHGFLGPGVSR